MPKLGDLDGLPPEILLEVLKNLCARDLLRCQRVCRALKDHIDGCAATKYTVQLALHGYEDGCQARDGTTASKLERFRALMHRWKHLDWVESRVRLPKETWDRALVGGVFACIDYGRIFCVELPSRLRQSPIRTWSHTNISFPIKAFSMDPSQDLVVLLELQRLDNVDYTTADEEGEDSEDHMPPYQPILHLRTLSDNTPHPRASSSTLQPKCLAIDVFVQMKILDDSLGLLFGTSGDENDPNCLIVWNWRAADPLSVIELHEHISSFLFIGPRTVLLPRYGGESNEITVYELENKDTDAREVVSLGLPLTLPAVFTPHVSSGPLNQRLSGRSLFQSLDSHIIKVQRQLRYPHPLVDSALDSFDLFVPVSLIKRYAHQCNHGLIRWPAWGEDNSRLVMTTAKGDCYVVHGNRSVSFDGRLLVVRHFSPNVAAWWDSPEASPNPQNGSATVFMDPAKEERMDRAALPPLSLFNTHLPYGLSARDLETRFRGRHHTDSILIDDEHILLVDCGRIDDEGESELVILSM